MLFCTSYFNDIKRYLDWAYYYNKYRTNLGVNDIYMIDDASPQNAITEIEEKLSYIPNFNIYSFSSHLGRPGPIQLEGWLRSFLYSYVIATENNYDRIIHIESDTYIFNFEKIKNITSGWHLPNFQVGFPETSIQVICKDKFNELKIMHDIGLDLLSDKIVETKFLNKTLLDMKGDRWQDFTQNPHVFRTDIIPPGRDLDYMCQISDINQIMNYIEI